MSFSKVVILIVISVVCMSIVKAQEFGGGVIAGVSSSQLSGDHLGGFNKLGLLLGVYTNRSLSRKLNVKMELNYIEKGSRNPENNLTGAHEYSLNYIEIPVLLQYQAQSNIKIESGLYLGVLMKEVESYADGVIVEGNNPSNGSFNKTDFGFCIGLDYSISNSLSINSRLNNTFLFTPVRAHASGAEIWYNQGQYNTVLSFAIHYHLQ